MSIDEPTFTYDASKPLTEEQKRGLEEVRRNPQPLRFVDDARDSLRVQQMLDGEGLGAYTVHDEVGRKVATLKDIREGIAAEALAHQWEHKSPGPRAVAYDQLRNTRIFTREEVVTVLKADIAARASDVRPEEISLLRYLIRLFERME